MDFWITFSKTFNGKGVHFCVATRVRVWDVPVLASQLKNAKINLAVPSDTTLKIESSKYSKEIRHSCLYSFSLASPTPKSNFLLTAKTLYSVGDYGKEDLYGLDWKDPEHLENAGKGSTQKRRLSLHV